MQVWKIRYKIKIFRRNHYRTKAFTTVLAHWSCVGTTTVNLENNVH